LAAIATDAASIESLLTTIESNQLADGHNVTIDNASGNIYAIDPGDLILLNTATDATYRNTALVNIGSMQTGVIVAVQADIEGSGGTAAAGAIDDFVTTFLGLSVTNDAALVGTDAELDPELRSRAELATGALSPNGPADAYRYFAASAVRAADGEAIGVTRIKVTPDGAGGVAVVVATGSGGGTGTSGDPDTDLAVWFRHGAPMGIALPVNSAQSIRGKPPRFKLEVPP
jgi:phage-related baseplate assembly protein